MAAGEIISITRFDTLPSSGAMPFKRNTGKLGAAESEEGETSQGLFGSSLRNVSTRRPTRGLQIKGEVPATITVLDASGFGRRVFNSSAHEEVKVSFTTNFLLQNVSIPRTEKFQPVPTFGPTYGFFFGEHPVIIQANAILVDSEDFPWALEWWANYDEYFRGTRLVDRDIRLYFEYEDFILGGYLITSQMLKDTQDQHKVPMTFSMWVTEIDFKVTPGDPNFASYESRFGYTEFSLQPVDDAGEFVSTTQEVRAANIESKTAFSLIGWLRSAIDEANSFLSAKLQAAKNVLYGRNIRVPAGFAASEINAGPAIFASGSGEEDLLRQLGSSFVTVRLPPEFSVLQSVAPRSTFYNNVDEYPFRAQEQLRTSEEVQEAFKASIDEAFRVTRTGRVVRLPDWFGEGGTTSIVEEVGEDDIVQMAEEKWRKAGYPNISNASGGGIPEVGLLLARAAFGVVSFATTLEGTDQQISRLNPVLGPTETFGGLPAVQGPNPFWAPALQPFVSTTQQVREANEQAFPGAGS